MTVVGNAVDDGKWVPVLTPLQPVSQLRQTVALHRLRCIRTVITSEQFITRAICRPRSRVDPTEPAAAPVEALASVASVAVAASPPREATAPLPAASAATSPLQGGKPGEAPASVAPPAATSPLPAASAASAAPPQEALLTSPVVFGDFGREDTVAMDSEASEVGVPL